MGYFETFDSLGEMLDSHKLVRAPKTLVGKERNDASVDSKIKRSGLDIFPELTSFYREVTSVMFNWNLKQDSFGGNVKRLKEDDYVSGTINVVGLESMLFGPTKTPQDGWINKFWVPKSILASANEHTPDPSAGDQEWEDKGKVIKGKWHHIEERDWKFGFQWTLKDEKQIHQELKFAGAKHPFPAADAWGRGRGTEYPQYFRPDGSEWPKPRNIHNDPWGANESERLVKQVGGMNPYESRELQYEGTKGK